MHLHHLTLDAHYFNKDTENSPIPLPSKTAPTKISLSLPVLYQGGGTGREEGREIRERKQIHTTSKT